MSVRSFLIAATTRYSGFFLLSLVTRFACDIGQLAKIWIWVSSEVITICIQWVCEYQSNSWILHSLLHRAEETQHGRNSCPRLQFGFQFKLYRVFAPLSFLRSISLASLFTRHCLCISGVAYNGTSGNMSEWPSVVEITPILRVMLSGNLRTGCQKISWKESYEKWVVERVNYLHWREYKKLEVSGGLNTSLERMGLSAPR